MIKIAIKILQGNAVTQNAMGGLGIHFLFAYSIVVYYCQKL